MDRSLRCVCHWLTEIRLAAPADSMPAGADIIIIKLTTFDELKAMTNVKAI